MEFSVRHLSGSRSGEEQSFNTDLINVGRNPTNQIAFNPESDLMVSGRHAEIFDRNGALVLHDLGSSNGTWVEGDRVTERILKPGDIVQFGKNGPRVQFQFRGGSEGSAAAVGNADAGGEIPMEGRTVAMMMNPGDSGRMSSPLIVPPTIRPMQAVGKKKSPVVVILVSLFVIFILFVLVGFGGLMILRRRSQAARNAAIEAAKKVEATKVVEASQIRSQIEQKQADVAATQQKLATATSTSTSPSGDNADMQRQLSQSQQQIDMLTRQLQAKNDEINNVRQEASHVQTKTVYVPVPRPVAPPPSTPASTPSNKVSNSSPSQTGASTPAQQTALAGIPNLVTGKHLKKKIYINALPPEVPPANLPGGTARQLADLIGTALTATGDYDVESKGIAQVNISVVNFVGTRRSNLNVSTVTQNASRIGGLFGKSIPTTPVNATSATYDSSMAARVHVYDKIGHNLGEYDPASAAHGTRNGLSLDPIGVPFNTLFGTDTPPGDVARDIVGQAVEGIRESMTKVEWYGSVGSQSSNGKTMTLDAGRNCNVELGDVFSIDDGATRLAAVKVVAVDDNSSTVEVIAGGGKLGGKTAHYLGIDSSMPSQYATGSPVRHLLMRIATPVYAGPGTSFDKVMDLRKGSKVNFVYTVGIWAKATEGGKTFWVPLTAAQIVA